MSRFLCQLVTHEDLSLNVTRSRCRTFSSSSSPPHPPPPPLSFFFPGRAKNIGRDDLLSFPLSIHNQRIRTKNTNGTDGRIIIETSEREKREN